MFSQVKPVDMGLFAGVLDYSKISFMTIMIVKSKMKKKGVPEGGIATGMPSVLGQKV